MSIPTRAELDSLFAVVWQMTDDDFEHVAGGVCWGNCDDYGP